MTFYKERTAHVANTFSPRRKAKESGLGAKQASKDSPKLFDDFMEDWAKLRVRHRGQEQILKAFFDDNKKYLFLRIGRKGAKTTTNIDIAWRHAFLVPKSTTFICLPTITQAIEVYWDEKRLQWCDINDGWMADKYISNIDNNKHLITFVNGSSIKLIGTWSEARGRGTQPNLLIVDEIQDASAEYLDAMEPNLAAKEDSRCVMSGTPPKKKNHYHEWEERIQNNTEGFHAKYSSYINTALPHLAPWLDKKKIELIAAGKEDVWLREYMAEDCFRSDDRMMPDVSLEEFDQFLFKLRSGDPTAYQPVLGLVVTDHHITATYNLLLHTRYTGSQIFTLESQHINRIWDKSYAAIYAEMKAKMAEYSRIFPKKWREVVFDDTESFSDVVPGIGQARKDLKWSKRGVPLLKEMILAGKMSFTNKAAQMGVECQNLLKEDDIRDYPTLAAMAMLANEYYQSPSLSKHEQEVWNQFAPLREAGIVAPLPKQRALREYGRGVL